MDNMETLIFKMTEDTQNNIKEIEKVFGDINYKDDEEQSLLHLFVDKKYDEDKCFYAIKSLLEIGLSPNLEDCFYYNFIQTALYSGYSETFILKIINESLKYNLDVNHVDSDEDTIMHTAIYSDDYLDEIINIYNLLCDNGYDPTKTDHDGNNLLAAMKKQNDYFEEKMSQRKYSNEQIEKFAKIFLGENFQSNYLDQVMQNGLHQQKKHNLTSDLNPTFNKISVDMINELEKIGKILNFKHYISEPTIGRENELKNLIITLAQDKKRPLLIGNSGVGKTVLIDELAYRIQSGNVPTFLQDKIILEIDPSDIVAGRSCVGQFEENMKKVLKICEKNNVILFIDEIHTIFGIGTSKDKNNDMSSMLKHSIDRTDLKVIGTTTKEEYDIYFSNSTLKRKFEKIEIKEPDQILLYKIIDKTINDYYLKTKITFKNEDFKKIIIDIIIDSTNIKSRVQNDIVNNPDLSISIIDKAFAFAKVYNSDYIGLEHFIESFKLCERIYDPTKYRAILKLSTLDTTMSKPKSKILKIDFNKYKK